MDLSSITFGIGRSATGPRDWEWRSSIDSYAATISTYTAVDAGLTNTAGVLNTPDVSNSWTGNVLDLSGAAFQDIATVTFRFYGYSSEGAAGTGGLQGPLTFGGALQSTTGNNVSIGPGSTFAPASFGGAAFVATDTAVFDGTAGQIDLAGAVEAAGLNFTVTGYTLAGTLGNTISTPSVEVGAGLTATIDGQITGANPLIKTGTGELILSGSNDFVGNVNISGTLSISEDANLGAAANDVTLAVGTLKALNSVTLNSSRDITGSGGLAAAANETLTITGSTNVGLTIAGTGTVALAGASNTLNSLSFSEAGALTIATGTATIAGNLSTTHTAGTARVNGPLDFGATSATRTITVADGSDDVDFDIASNLISGTSAVRLHKLGDGTLRVSGDNSALLGGVRLGNANGTYGGRLLVTGSNSLGAAQFQFNNGIFEAETETTFANGVSIGGVSGAPAVIQGANVTFSGSSSFFTQGAVPNLIQVNNTTTLNGLLVHTGAGGSSLQVGGSGTMRVNGSAAGVAAPTSIINTATLVINNQWGSSAAATVLVDLSATLKGSGTIAGLVEVYGTHAVGNSVGIQEAQNGVSYLNGSTFEWELTGNADTGPGTNFDQLIVSGGNINIEDVSTLELVFNSAGSTVNWSDSFWDSDHTWTVVNMTGPGSLTGMFGLSASSTWFDFDGDLLSSVRATADFDVAAGGAGSQSVILTYTAVVPEPSTCALLLGGLGAIGWATRRRRRI